jgi:hypothetical protein
MVVKAEPQTASIWSSSMEHVVITIFSISAKEKSHPDLRFAHLHLVL